MKLLIRPQGLANQLSKLGLIPLLKLATEADQTSTATLELGRGSRGGSFGSGRRTASFLALASAHTALTTDATASRLASLLAASLSTTAGLAAVHVATAAAAAVTTMVAATAAAAGIATATTATTARAATTAVASQHFAFAPNEGDTDDREENRDAEQKSTIHP